MIPGPFVPYFQEAQQRYPQVPAGVLYGVLQTENASWNPNAVNPTSGAQGLGQFVPETARGLGINPFDPRQAIIGTAQYLAQLMGTFGGDITHAVAAYNAGPGRVQQLGLAGVLSPTFAQGETQRYVKSVFGYAGEFGGSGTPTPGGVPSAPASGNPVLGCLPMAAMLALGLGGVMQWLCR